MATTLHDTEYNDDSATSGALATHATIAVSTGDLIVACFAWEGATTTVTFSDTVDTYSVARAVTGHSTNTDFWATVGYTTATTTGSRTITATPGASRPFRKLRVYSYTPTAGTSLVLDSGAGATASGNSTNPSAGAVTTAGAGCAQVFFPAYNSKAMDPGTGWTEESEFNYSSALSTEHRIYTSGGSITGDATWPANDDWIAILTAFKEQAPSGGAVAIFANNYFR